MILRHSNRKMRKKILVADDEIAIQELLKVNLEAEGYAVVPAYNGKEALRLIGEERPDLLILDVSMPEMDGWEVCGKLKGGEEKNPLPVIFLSAFTQKVDIERGIELGAKDFITKPFNIKVLMQKVNKLLSFPQS
jgi:DNA-binding response OmpR family regulator